MSSVEAATLLDVVEKLYTLTPDDTSWSMPLDLMADVFGAVGASFETIERATNRPVFIEVGSNLSPTPAQEYMDHYASVSPRVKNGSGKPSGFISYDRMILTESEMDRDEFYADCMAPQGLRYFLAAQVFTSPGHESVFAVHRSAKQGHVDDKHISVLEQLVPHLRQAMDLKFRMSAAWTQGKLGFDGLERLNEGCLVLDTAGAVLHMNLTAEQMISNGDGIGVSNGHLCFADKAASHRQRRALGRTFGRANQQGADSARDFPAHRPSGKRPYLVAIRPLPQQSAFEPDPHSRYPEPQQFGYRLLRCKDELRTLRIYCCGCSKSTRKRWDPIILA